MELKQYGYYRLNRTTIGGSTFGTVDISCLWTNKDTSVHRVEQIRIVRGTSPSIPEYYVKWSDEISFIEITDLSWNIEFIPSTNYTTNILNDNAWTDLNENNFVIYFFKMYCEKNKVHKSWRITGTTNGDIQIIKASYGQLKESSSITNPTVTFEWDEHITPDFNYIYIPLFKRYYFVSNPVWLTNNIWVVNARVDVLKTYEVQINAQTGFITRQRFNFSLDILDNKMPFKYEKVIEEQIRDHTGTGYINFSGVSVVDNNILLIIADKNSGGTYSGVNTNLSGVLNNPDKRNLPSLFKNSVYIIDKASLKTLQQWIYANGIDNYKDYIVACIEYPFDLLAGSSPTAIGLSIDGQLITGVGVYKYEDTPQILSGIIRNTQFSFPLRSSFMDLEPYTTYELYLPYRGWIELNGSQVTSTDESLVIQVSYAINMLDGSAMVFVTEETNELLLYSSPCQIGISIPFNNDNSNELALRRTQTSMNMIFTSLIGMMDMGKNGATGDFASMGKSWMKTSQELYNSHMGLQLLQKHANAQISSGEIGLYAPQYARTRVTKSVEVFENLELQDYADLYGLPCNKPLQLSTLSGYTEVGEIHLHDFDTATDNEIDMVENELHNGVIL